MLDEWKNGKKNPVWNENIIGATFELKAKNATVGPSMQIDLSTHWFAKAVPRTLDIIFII